MPGEVIDGNSNSSGGDVIKHVYEEAGVKIVAITDSETGKIITAYPRI